MCAICGVLDYGRIDDEAVGDLIKIREAMTNRGPDDAGLYRDEDIVLGVRRLSIIDLLRGHQPVSNETGTVWVALNGEIYNYLELRDRLEAQGHRFATQSDTETIVHLYEEEGEDCWTHLRGMFAVAIWDRQRRKLLLARDRLGIKPLYYTWKDGRLLFASELKGLWQSDWVSRKLSLTSLDLYLQLDYVPSPYTIVEGVFKLLPGHCLIVEDRRLWRLKPYWHIPESDNADCSHPSKLRQAEEQLRQMVRDSVRLHLRSDVPVGILLSGGSIRVH